MRDLFGIFLLSAFVAACSPVDSEVYGVKKQLVAYEKLPILRSPVQVINMNDRVRIVINSNKVFTDSSAKFSGNYRTLLAPLEKFLNNNKLPNHVVVNGYQSSIGDAQRLTKLSKQQADALASYIWALGIPSDIISVVAHGGNDLVSSDDTASGNIENRRINVDIF